MNNQKGQIAIILFLIVITIVLVFVFYKPNEQVSDNDSSSNIVPQQEYISPQQESISPSQEQAKPVPVKSIDNSPPYRSNAWPSGTLAATTRKVTLSLETSEKATCRYDTVGGVSYFSMGHVFINTNSTVHSTEVTGLNEGEWYFYYIKCVDEFNNINTDDFVIYFKVNEPADFTPPVRSNQYPTGDVLSYVTQTMIGISTNEKATCRYDTQQGISYNSMKKNLTDDGTKKYHTAIITGLNKGQSYSYFVRCKDLKGNTNTGDVMISFSVSQY